LTLAASGKRQAASGKRQAASGKRQAASGKRQVGLAVRESLNFVKPFLCSWLALNSIAHSQEKTETSMRIAAAFAATVQKIPYADHTPTFKTEWPITNHWSNSLQLERIESSCDCLVGKFEMKPIAPGATGILYTFMTPGNHRGLLRKSLHVRFVGHQQAVELISEIHIPSSVELSHQEIAWEQDDHTTRAIDVTSGTDAPFQITALLGVPEQFFTITQETISPSKHYRISITPKKSAHSAVHCLQIRTDSKDTRDQVRAVFLHTGARATDNR
jgi:hypothetical protein